MRSRIAAWLLSLGLLTRLLLGLIAWAVCVGIVADIVGSTLLGALLSLALLPIVVLVAPIYALVAQDRWSPLVVTYGSVFIAMLPIIAARAIHAPTVELKGQPPLRAFEVHGFEVEISTTAWGGARHGAVQTGSDTFST